eukprot:1529064-Rhodomonas_salina.2
MVKSVDRRGALVGRVMRAAGRTDLPVRSKAGGAEGATVPAGGTCIEVAVFDCGSRRSLMPGVPRDGSAKGLKSTSDVELLRSVGWTRYDRYRLAVCDRQCRNEQLEGSRVDGDSADRSAVKSGSRRRCIVGLPPLCARCRRVKDKPDTVVAPNRCTWLVWGWQRRDGANILEGAGDVDLTRTVGTRLPWQRHAVRPGLHRYENAVLLKLNQHSARSFSSAWGLA